MMFYNGFNLMIDTILSVVVFSVAYFFGKKVERQKQKEFEEYFEKLPM